MRKIAILASLSVLAACSSDAPPVTLAEASIANGAPDEFLVLPQRPLEMPDDLETLPEPDLEAGTRVAIDPIAEAKRAVGGTGGSTRATATDQAMLAAARTVGVNPNIRAELRAETEAKIARPGGLAGFLDIFRISDRKKTAFDDQRLDALGELKRRQAQDVRTPAYKLTLEQ